MNEAAICGGYQPEPIRVIWSALLELGRDVIELGVETRADCIDGGDDDDRNTSGNQAVFNRSRARLVL
jgi:hypothetical protein